MPASQPEQPWVPRLHATEGPIYRSIADAIGRAVADGALQPGERLPTHRALADMLGVDLTTVTRAYAEARRRGLLQATVGRGTFVRPTESDSPAAVPDGPIDLSMNLPPIPDRPSLPALMQQGLAGMLSGSEVSSLLSYRGGSGSPAEREAGVAWLRPTLNSIDPARLLVSPGAQPALLTVLRMLTDPGDLIVTDRLAYPGLRSAASLAGLRVVGLAGDEAGLLPDALNEACHVLRPKLVCCTPTIHNPTTATMPIARRQAIAETARRHGLPILEDDAYGVLPAAPLPALAALAPELGYHVATLSKVMSPALRVAYVVAPDRSAATRLAVSLRATVLMGSPMMTELVTRWIQDGTAEAILAAIRRECTARQAIARSVLPAGSFAAHAEGLHVWLRLPPRWDRRDFVAHLRQRDGLAVVPSDAFAVDPAQAPPDAVRLALGAARGQDALRAALGNVAAAWETAGPAKFIDVV